MPSKKIKYNTRRCTGPWQTVKYKPARAGALVSKTVKCKIGARPGVENGKAQDLHAEGFDVRDYGLFFNFPKYCCCLPGG